MISWVLPAVIFFGLWALLVRGHGGADQAHGDRQKQGRVYLERSTGVSFEDVADIDEARSELMVPFFSLTGSDFVEMFVGVSAARVRDLFAHSQAKVPSIIFIDAEIQQLQEAVHARVRQTLTAKRAALDPLAKLLIEQEVVDRTALTRFLSQATQV